MNSFFRDVHILLFLTAIYGLAVALGGWFFISAATRHRYQGWLQGLLSTGTVKLLGITKNGVRAAAQMATSRSLFCRSAAHRRAGLAALAILVAPAIAVQVFTKSASFEAYDDLPPPTDPVIAALLHGERLVAPLPLPPELFITNEVESERQEVASASREWGKLDADFRQRLLAIFQVMAGHGYQMVLLEGYRSPQRQAELARRGTHVTNAGAYQSYHQYGLAADIAFYRDGKIVISEKDPWAMDAYRLYGRYAESAGLVWGGKWQMMDFGHVELRKPGVLARR